MKLALEDRLVDRGWGPLDILFPKGQKDVPEAERAEQLERTVQTNNAIQKSIARDCYEAMLRCWCDVGRLHCHFPHALMFRTPCLLSKHATLTLSVQLAR
jgi:hypothetical protein